ncbi:hypothetical protein V8F06_010163 [Rhypophila decipiens]
MTMLTSPKAERVIWAVSGSVRNWLIENAHTMLEIWSLVCIEKRQIVSLDESTGMSRMLDGSYSRSCEMLCLTIIVMNRRLVSKEKSHDVKLSGMWYSQLPGRDLRIQTAAIEQEQLLVNSIQVTIQNGRHRKRRENLKRKAVVKMEELELGEQDKSRDLSRLSRAVESLSGSWRRTGDIGSMRQEEGAQTPGAGLGVEKSHIGRLKKQISISVFIQSRLAVPATMPIQATIYIAGDLPLSCCCSALRTGGAMPYSEEEGSPVVLQGLNDELWLAGSDWLPCAMLGGALRAPLPFSDQRRGMNRRGVRAVAPLLIKLISKAIQPGPDDTTFEEHKPTEWKAYVSKETSVSGTQKDSGVGNTRGDPNRDECVLPVKDEEIHEAITPDHFANDKVDRDEAIAHANNVLAMSRSHRKRFLPVFGDCSALLIPDNTVPMKGSYAVVLSDQESGYDYCPSSTFRERNVSSWKVDELHESTNGELLALAEMLNMIVYLRKGFYSSAGKDFSTWSDCTTHLHVYAFTDSTHSLRCIQQRTRPNIGHNPVDDPRKFPVNMLEEELAQPIVVKVIQLVKELEASGKGVERCLNCRVHFRWLPGHFHYVFPHVEADDVAKATAKGYCQNLLAEILRKGCKGTPVYQSIGADLQKQVRALARSHFALDNDGRGLSEKGKKMEAQRGQDTGSSSSWLRQLTRGSATVIGEKAKRLLNTGLCCGTNSIESPKNENIPPSLPQKPAKRKLTEEDIVKGTLPPAKRHQREKPLTNHPTTSLKSILVPPCIAALMANKKEFPTPPGGSLSRRNVGRRGRY